MSFFRRCFCPAIAFADDVVVNNDEENRVCQEQNDIREEEINKGPDLAEVLHMKSPSLLQGNAKAKEFLMDEHTKLVISQGDITKWRGGSKGAIVNAANERMLGGGGVDGAIHRAAGPELLEACRNHQEVTPGVRCPTGEARLTEGFDLPAGYVIHTVGPVYSNPIASKFLLELSYRNSYRIANKQKLECIAFPAISCGVYGYPKEDAAEIAITAAFEFKGNLTHLEYVLFDRDTYNTFVKASKKIISEKKSFDTMI
eukprot:CAMPEP_0117734486 /NCGR_PEP_ID=MMETSP0947-20121206/703_1 /TAXON_ID=44440 /ORGANISM="Chattonella subsalsa, Strain CCMP2191" /LENGTH=256 /DNA_ID=CAMNT_0005549275 /DNA_START=268 /DNA_END=1038 /DNA_ORIENTATION=+